MEAAFVQGIGTGLGFAVATLIVVLIAGLLGSPVLTQIAAR